MLCPADADRAHPAFQKLFVETEWRRRQATLLASRRPRAARDVWPWCVTSSRPGPNASATSRARRIARAFSDVARTVRRPARARSRGVHCRTRVGAVLDPIVAFASACASSRVASATVAFTTAVVADARGGTSTRRSLSRRRAPRERALSFARTEAEVELRDLDVAPTDVGALSGAGRIAHLSARSAARAGDAQRRRQR